MPFEIFSPAEITELKKHASEEYKEQLDYLINIINLGIHQETGWKKHLTQQLTEIKEEAKCTKIFKGLEQYLSVANTLQKPPAGQIEKRMIPAKYKAGVEFLKMPIVSSSDNKLIQHINKNSGLPDVVVLNEEEEIKF